MEQEEKDRKKEQYNARQEMKSVRKSSEVRNSGKGIRKRRQIQLRVRLAKIFAERYIGAPACFCKTYLYNVSCYDRMGVFLFSQYWKCIRISRDNAWNRGKWFRRFHGSILFV